jgi:chorismate mutase
MGEAADLARFTRNYWQPVEGQTPRPGLVQAGKKLPETIANDLIALQEALQTAHTDYLMVVSPMQSDVRSRAQFVLGEITAALEWLFDDGVDDARDQQLAALKAEHADAPASIDALAAELGDYATLAADVKASLDGLGGFNTALIDEAFALSRSLLDKPTNQASPEVARSALELRNRIATLLTERMGLVRAAARFVFRNQPDIARLTGSAYDRRRRAALRRQAASGSAPSAVGQANSPATA